MHSIIISSPAMLRSCDLPNASFTASSGKEREAKKFLEPNCSNLVGYTQ